VTGTTMLGLLEVGLGLWTLSTKREPDWRLVGFIEVGLGVWMIARPASPERRCYAKLVTLRP
jgi:hypothetical protein